MASKSDLEVQEVILTANIIAFVSAGPCYRECIPGETMVCKFVFHEEIYNALNS